MSASNSLGLKWTAPAGQLLRTFIQGLPTSRPIILNIFGSSPLQLTLDETFLSGDVDLFSNEDLSSFASSLGLAKGQHDPYIEVNPPSTFIASPSWRDRAVKETFGNITVYVAAPIDVLVAKLKRLEEKDLRAFDLVRRLTGGPSEAELKAALSEVVDMYRPAFDEENPGGDPVVNTQRLWQHLFQRDINVREEIIRPALEKRRIAYGQPSQDYRAALEKKLKE